MQDTEEPNLLFAGTEQGLWISLDNGNNFKQWKNGYPSVSTYDMAIQQREADLVIATFGRAIYVLDDIRPLRKLASDNKSINKKLIVFAAPDAIQAQFRNAPGYEWSTWGIWDAANKPGGAAISFLIAKDKDTSSKKTKKDSVLVKIYNYKNELTRTLKWKIDSGFNRLYWGLEAKGYRFPGSTKPKPEDAEPGGSPVLPGAYKVLVQYLQDSDSTVVSVLDDPRLGNRNEIKLAQQRMQDRLRQSSDKLTEGMDRLAEAEEVCKKIDAQTKDLEGKEVDSLRKSTKAMQDSIKSIREFINGKTQERQGISDLPQITVINQFQEANQSIRSKPVVPGPQVEMLVQRAEGLIGEAIRRLNGFFEGSWKNYKQQSENTKVNLFKEFKPL